MEDVIEQNLETQSDLDQWYEMAYSAKKTGDIKQAIKISEKALKTAKGLKDKKWIKQFDSLHSDVKETYLVKKHDNYIKKAEKEEEVFYNNEKAVHYYKKAKKNLNKLFKLGKNEAKIRKQIQTLEKKISKLNKLEEGNNNEAELKKQIQTLEQRIQDLNKTKEVKSITKGLKKQIKELDNKVDKLKPFKDPETSSGDEYFYTDKKPQEAPEVKDVIQRLDKESNKPKLRGVPKRLKKPKVPNKQIDMEEEEALRDEKIQEKSTQGANDIISGFLDDDPQEKKVKIKRSKASVLQKQRNGLKAERLEDRQLRRLEGEIKTIVKESNFKILPKKLRLTKHISEEVNLIAVKVIHADELTDLILIFPIKICNLKGSLQIYEKEIQYIPAQDNLDLDESKESILLGPNIKPLQDSQNNIFNNLIEEGSLFKFLKRYLKINISAEKTITNKRLFFRSAQLQYKILIEPILISENVPRFGEKWVKYPYQKETNFHYIETERLSELLEFLEKKYELIETYSEQKSPINTYFGALDKLTTDVRLLSIPLMIYGIITSMVLVFQNIPVFISLLYAGIGGLTLYGIGVSLLYLKYYKQRIEIIKDFKIPYYKKSIDLRDSDISDISDTISTEWLDQFLYEIYGKEPRFNEAVKLIEREKTDFIKKKRQTKDLFEDDEVDEKHFPFKKDDNKEEIYDKYSSFLED